MSNKFYSFPKSSYAFYTAPDPPTYNFSYDWDNFSIVRQSSQFFRPPVKENTLRQTPLWPKTNIDVDVILQYLVKDGVPDVRYGVNIRLLLDACTWTTTDNGGAKLIVQDDKKKMLNSFVNTFSNVEETIFWLKFADEASISDRMEKVRLMIALND